MPKYEEIELTVSKKGEKDSKYWIKGSDGEFYGGFRDFEGILTDGYNSFLELNEGDNVVITYSKSVGANDKIYRNVRSIHQSSRFPSAILKGSPSAVAPKTAPVSQNTASQGKSDDFGRRLAVHGMINGILASGVKPFDVTTETIRAVISLEDRIDLALKPSPMDYNKVFNKEPDYEPPYDVQQEIDGAMDVSDVPF